MRRRGFCIGATAAGLLAGARPAFAGKHRWIKVKPGEVRLFIPEVEDEVLVGFMGSSALVEDLHALRKGLELRKRKGGFRPENGTLGIRLAAGTKLGKLLKSWAEGAGAESRRDFKILLHTEVGERAYTLHACWPKSWRPIPASAKSGDVAMEELVLVVETIEVD
jgi:hypothetical protein